VLVEEKVNFSDMLEESLQSLVLAKINRIKLILHVGTPKTGTTSMQVYLAKRQSKLRRKGILYPHNLEKIKHSTAPKHQWFEKNLVSENFEYFLENIQNIIAQINQDTHTIIISSEGIYNFWWDFSDESKKLLNEFSQLFDTQVWVWFRDPLEFAESYYKQCIRNPQVEGNLCYGKDLSFAEMLEIKWFYQHLDYQGFVNECEVVFGKEQVLAFEYKGDVVTELIQKLGLTTPYDNPTPRKNKNLNNVSVELLKMINRYDVKAKDKDRLMPHLKAIDEVLDSYKNESLIDQESKKKILDLLNNF